MTDRPNSTITDLQLRNVILTTALRERKVNLHYRVPLLDHYCLSLMGSPAELVELAIALHTWAVEHDRQDLVEAVELVQHRKTMEGSVYYWPWIAPPQD